MIRILQGDCREVLSTLAADSVHCVVTSPPYYGLRDYGTAQWEGGDAGCDHAPIGNDRGPRDELPKPPAGWAERAQGYANGKHCPRCGARRIDSQLGLEASPEDYIAEMVAVFREVRRVLRDDGTCWMNLGDAFTDKQLQMMPARLALALQADGWWIRSDIIWAKPNPMPESVTDRPTSAHEHIFLLTKSARYFYDAEAVREELQDSTIERGYTAAHLANGGGPKEQGNTDKMVRGGKGWWDNAYVPAGRNARNVWTIATAPYSEAHFATFPPALAERCIKAGTSERGCCAACGKPWERQIEKSGGTIGKAWHDHSDDLGRGQRSGASSAGMETYRVTTTGWAPACQCDAATVPCTVLDPFAGAGTTGLVADRLQRNTVLIELSAAYCAMLRNRIVKDAPLLAEVAD